MRNDDDRWHEAHTPRPSLSLFDQSGSAKKRGSFADGMHKLMDLAHAMISLVVCSGLLFATVVAVRVGVHMLLVVGRIVMAAVAWAAGGLGAGLQ